MRKPSDNPTASIGDCIRVCSCRESKVGRTAGNPSEGAAHAFAGVAKAQADSEMAAQAQRSELEANRAKHLRHQANLLKAIKDSGGVRSLFEELKEVEAKIDRIDEILVNSEKKVVQEISIEEVREFVNTQAGSFEELLMGSAESVKHEFRKRITATTLTPILDARGLVYIVTGDVDLLLRLRVQCIRIRWT